MCNNDCKTLSKADIAATIQVVHDISKAEATKIVNTVAETILKALEDGRTVEWYCFFTLTPKWKEEHPAINPKTGERIIAPAKWTVSMKLSETVKNAVKSLPSP